MKKYLKLLRFFFALALLTSIHTFSFSQPPPPAALHGTSGDAVPGGGGGGAPIGEGMFILLGLAGLYGGKKWYDSRKALDNKDL
jgi:hypothetical protein